MRAWRLNELSGIDALTLDEVDMPEPGPGEVRVRVEAVGINSSELQLLQGYWTEAGVPPSLPHIAGTEGAGIVDAVGDGVTEPAVGTRIFTNYWWNCGTCHECLSGWENTCENAIRQGRHVPGAYGEYLCMPADQAIPVPEPMDSIGAAALGVVGATAWHMLFVHAGLKAGETVLITGGSSAIGTIATLLARLAGAKVIATAGHDWKLDRMKELGADLVINHTNEPDFTARVRDFTGGEGVGVVYEAVGDATFGAAMRSMRPRGRLIVGGYMGGATTQLSLIGVLAGEFRIFGSRSWTRDTMRRVLSLGATGQLPPIIDSVFDFEKLPEGLRKLEDRNVFGKVVAQV
jgi:NADPH:quinone reductase-like Zn-dependent oxidoreductase